MSHGETTPLQASAGKQVQQLGQAASATGPDDPAQIHAELERILDELGRGRSDAASASSGAAAAPSPAKTEASAKSETKVEPGPAADPGRAAAPRRNAARSLWAAAIVAAYVIVVGGAAVFVMAVLHPGGIYLALGAGDVRGKSRTLLGDAPRLAAAAAPRHEISAPPPPPSRPAADALLRPPPAMLPAAETAAAAASSPPAADPAPPPSPPPPAATPEERPAPQTNAAAASDAEKPAAASPAEPAAPAAAPGPAPLSPESIAALLQKGDEMVALGDIAAARLCYEPAARAGDAGAMMALGRSFDPAVLMRAGVHGALANAAKAAEWYGLAQRHGASEAERALQDLSKRQLR